MKGQKLRRS